MFSSISVAYLFGISADIMRGGGGMIDNDVNIDKFSYKNNKLTKTIEIVIEQARMRTITVYTNTSNYNPRQASKK